MGKTELVASFDYESVDKETKGKLVALAGQVKRHGTDLIKSVVEIGEAIHLANELLAPEGGGRFKAWIESETGLASTTAYEWMAVYRRSLNFPIIGKFPPTVAYLLSPESVPDAAIKDFEKQIDKGTRPTVAAAKATLERFKEPKVAASARTKAAKPGKVRSQSDEPSNGSPSEPPPAPVAPAAPVNEDSEPEEAAAPTPSLDHFKVVVTEKLFPIFAVTPEFRSTMKALSDLKSSVEKLSETEPGGFIDQQEFSRLLTTAHGLLRFAMPYTECAKCKRKTKEDCPTCKGRGWVNESLFKTAFSDADKAWLDKR